MTDWTITNQREEVDNATIKQLRDIKIMKQIEQVTYYSDTAIVSQLEGIYSYKTFFCSALKMFPFPSTLAA